MQGAQTEDGATCGLQQYQCYHRSPCHSAFKKEAQFYRYREVFDLGVVQVFSEGAFKRIRIKKLIKFTFRPKAFRSIYLDEI